MLPPQGIDLSRPMAQNCHHSPVTPGTLLPVSAFDPPRPSQGNNGGRLPEESATFQIADVGMEETLSENLPRPQLSTSPLFSADRSSVDEIASLQPLEFPSSSLGIDTPGYNGSSLGVEHESSDPTESISFGDTDDHSKLDGDMLRQRLELLLHHPNNSTQEDAHFYRGHANLSKEIEPAQQILDNANADAQSYHQSLPQSLHPLAVVLSRIDYASTDKLQEQGTLDEEEDLSPLEYARSNGLSRDHLQMPIPVVKLELLGDHRPEPTDDSHLPQFDLTANINTDERLTISKDALVLLNYISREGSAEWVDHTLFQMIDIRTFRDLKLELPLLRSDHETDCRKFAQRKGFELELGDVKLPLEMVDEEHNEGHGFSPGMWAKGENTLQNLKREKLEVTRDTLIYLQNTLKMDSTDNDNKIRETVCTYQKNHAREPVTPPLSPLIFPAQPFEQSMSDCAFDLPVLSDPESLSKQDLDAIEKELFNNDVPTPIREAKHGDESSDTLCGNKTIHISDIYSPVASLDRFSVSPELETKRHRWESYKVEEPLTPTRRAEHKEEVRFEDLAMECPITADIPDTDLLKSIFFEEAFGAAHERATRMSEQERLIAADTTARVDVPIMDFSLITPPWQSADCTPNSIWHEQQNMIEDMMQFSLPRWRLKENEPKRWNPFPHDLAKVALEERFIGDDSTWEALIVGSTDDSYINTTNLTWKPPGLRILRRDEDDDEEIEPATFEKGIPQDLSYLIKKRKVEIEERESSVLAAQSSAKQPPRKKTPSPAGFAPTVVPSHHLGEGSPLMGGVFSVGTSVDTFLEIRGLKKPRLAEISTLTTTTAQTKAMPTKLDLQPESLMQLPITISTAPKTATPLPAPLNNIADIPVNVIVASSLLKHRILIRHIEALAPKIILVERDFSAHDTMTWMPGSVARSPIVSPLASEADIIVSPFVGIILTTLQKIKQQPLPGQKAKAPIRERLLKVSVRYEKLIVLVTEGRADEGTGDLGDSDCTAFSEFVAFAITLPTTVNVQFVGGGEATLARWIVSSISAHKADVELLPDETHWELLLRRAGLNAFAAQAILAEVKAPDRASISSPGGAAHYGLAAFVRMGREERAARFGPICGYRLMERVSAAIDARWS